MNRKIWHLLILLIAAPGCFAYGQDHIYSQFFNQPIYLNPSLTGQFEGNIRMNLIYRNQWSGLSGDQSYISGSADMNIEKFPGGIGIIFNRSSEGTAYLVKNNAAVTYSYSVGGDDIVASFGIQAGITSRKIDWSKLVFADQIDMRLGYLPGSVSAAQPPDIDNKYFFDAATGVNFVYKNFMLGSAVYHLNRPDESFSGTQAKLPMRLTAYASFRIPLAPSYYYSQDEGSYLIPSVVYYKQASSSSLSAGAQFKFKGLNTGIWYRTDGQKGSDAIVVSLIFDLFKGKSNGENLRLGISHDATLSRINYTNTSGTTEASIGYQKYFPNSSGYNQFNGLRCYDFY